MKLCEGNFIYASMFFTPFFWITVFALNVVFSFFKINLSYLGFYFENKLKIWCVPFPLISLVKFTFFYITLCICLSVCSLVSLFVFLFVSMSVSLCDCMNVCPCVRLSFCRCFMDRVSHGTFIRLELRKCCARIKKKNRHFRREKIRIMTALDLIKCLI